MSGICAVWRKDSPEAVPGTLALAVKGLSCPPGERVALETCGEAGVGASVRFATQQIYRDENVVAACDADLVNERDLTAAVDSKQSKVTGTAGLMVALYRRYGCEFVEKLRGGFAVLLWDLHERRLIAAIDGFGIKRLVYADTGKMFLAASRTEALIRTGEIGADINPKAIANILNYSANLAPGTIFTRIQRLTPGTLLVRSGRTTRVNTYWDMRYAVGNDRDESRLSAELESTVERSVADCCKQDSSSELGAFLSGGTDSSTVLGMMTRARGEPMNAFSIGFEEERFNELKYADIAAKHFGSRHYTYRVTADDCLAALPDMVRSFDEPFGNSSAIPTYFCARLAARNGVSTLLAGDGGDELFGGNERYATDKIFAIYHTVPKLIRTGVIEPICAHLPARGYFKRASGYIHRANLPGVERMLSYQFLQKHAAPDVFTGDFLAALGDYAVVDIPAAHYARAQARDHLDRLLYVDVKITLADNDLPKVTCMSELAGVQVRFPFLDRSVAELSGRIPANLKVKGFDKRYLFKRAFRQLLPIDIINKTKHGFGIPVASWIRTNKRIGELARDTLLSSRALERGYFRKDFFRELFQKQSDDGTDYYGDTVWTILIIELWHRHIADQVCQVSV